MNELLLFAKHPYAAGIIAVIWVASTILYAIDRTLPILTIVGTNMFVSFLIAMIGFRTRK